MELQKKTQLQCDIENAVTNNRGYLHVPYMKIFGQKKSLKQWLMFTETGCRFMSKNIFHEDKHKIPISLAFTEYYKFLIPEIILSYLYIQARINKRVSNLESGLATLPIN